MPCKDFAARDQVVIATKVFYPMQHGPNERGLSRKHILHAIDASLRRLGIDYVDLYQIHRFDPDHADRGDARSAGRRRRAGQGALHRRVVDVRLAVREDALHVAIGTAGRASSSMQNHYNLVYREEEREMMPLCREEGIGVIPWSPLARGFLAGNRREGDVGETTRAKTDDFAHELYYGRRLRGRRPRDRGCRAPGVEARAGRAGLGPCTARRDGADRRRDEARAPRRRRGGAVERLSADEMAFLEEPYRPHGVLGFDLPPRR